MKQIIQNFKTGEPQSNQRSTQYSCLDRDRLLWRNHRRNKSNFSPIGNRRGPTDKLPQSHRL